MYQQPCYCGQPVAKLFRGQIFMEEQAGYGFVSNTFG